MQQTSLPHLMIRSSQGRHSAVQAENSDHYTHVTHMHTPTHTQNLTEYSLHFQFNNTL